MCFLFYGVILCCWPETPTCEHTTYYHLVIYHSHGKWPICRWFTYKKWWFSIAMLNNQMVYEECSLEHTKKHCTKCRAWQTNNTKRHTDWSMEVEPKKRSRGNLLETKSVGNTSATNNVLLVKIEGPVWYTIYHHLPVVKGVSSNPSINQPTSGKRTSMSATDNLHLHRPSGFEPWPPKLPQKHGDGWFIARR